jgi:nucleoside-diphosphate-sugar epimerase
MVLGRIGLTGATGMLGGHIYAAFKSAGIEIFASSRTSRDGFSKWDLCEWLTHDEFDAIFPEVDAVVHAGAAVNLSGDVRDAYTFDANVRACLNLGQWALARNIPIIFISGAIVYKDSYALLQRESAETGWKGLGGFYGFSKLLAEDVMLRLRQQGLKIAILRPTSIYGKNLSKEKLVQRFLGLAISGRVIELSTPIDDRVDLIHAADVARAVVLVLKNSKWDTFNLSSACPISIKDLAQACIDVAGKGRISINGQATPNYQPKVMYSLDSEFAAEVLKWRPLVDIHLGLNMILNNRYL